MKKIFNTFKLVIILMLSNSLSAQKNDFHYYIAGQSDSLQILDEKGKTISNETYSYIGQFSEGLFPVEKNEKFGFITVDGKLKIPFKYDYASEMINGVSVVKIDGKYGLIDRKGKFLIEPLLEDININSLKKGFIIYRKNGLEGLMNKRCKVIISNKFDYIKDIENGYVVAQKKRKTRAY